MHPVGKITNSTTANDVDQSMWLVSHGLVCQVGFPIQCNGPQTANESLSHGVESSDISPGRCVRSLRRDMTDCHVYDASHLPTAHGKSRLSVSTSSQDNAVHISWYASDNLHRNNREELLLLLQSRQSDHG